MAPEERSIVNEFGYCCYVIYHDYSLTKPDEVSAVIYNLYIYPHQRRKGKARALLALVIAAIRKTCYFGQIGIQAKPRENSIDAITLALFYRSMGLTIIEPTNTGMDFHNDEIYCTGTSRT